MSAKRERRNYLIRVFEHTEGISRAIFTRRIGGRAIPTTTRHSHDCIPIPPVRAGSQILHEKTPAEVEFTHKGTVGALFDLNLSQNAEKKVAVLNFASFKNAGGGAAIGSQAQEEDLCRCTTLYPSLAAAKGAGLYPLGMKHLFYTKDVVVVKDEAYRDVDTFASAIYPFDVISCAAVKLRSEHMPRGVNREAFAREATAREAERAKEAADIMGDKIEAIFRLAISFGVQILVLGLLGCGAYGNDAAMVAAHFRAVCDRYAVFFERIIFPFKHDPNSQQSIAIYEAFSRAFDRPCDGGDSDGSDDGSSSDDDDNDDDDDDDE